MAAGRQPPDATPWPLATFRAVGAINAAQDPEAVPFFARTGSHHSHWPGAPLGLRERGSTTGTVPVQYRPSGRAVCSGCYQRASGGPGSRSSSFFCSYKAATTHIGRSALCQTERKGIYTVPVQYRPSGRAEHQEAGPVGAGGAWPVRPAASAAAPGKHIVCCGWHIVCYDIGYDVVALYRMFLAM